VLSKLEPGNGALLFLDAPGGTGKTFLLILLLMSITKSILLNIDILDGTTVENKGKIILSVTKDQKIAVAVVSSGIAAILLTGGRTAH